MGFSRALPHRVATYSLIHPSQEDHGPDDGDLWDGLQNVNATVSQPGWVTPSRHFVERDNGVGKVEKKRERGGREKRGGEGEGERKT